MVHIQLMLYCTIFSVFYQLFETPTIGVYGRKTIRGAERNLPGFLLHFAADLSTKFFHAKTSKIFVEGLNIFRNITFFVHFRLLSYIFLAFKFISSSFCQTYVYNWQSLITVKDGSQPYSQFVGQQQTAFCNDSIFNYPR
jgi:hypothetical protein